MAFCKECGAQVRDGSIFCAQCGAAQESARTQEYEAPLISSEPPPAYEQPAYERPYAPEPPPAACSTEQRPPKGSPYAVIGSWGYFFSMLLLGIPVVGWVFTIVWACGGIRNYNLQRLARAFIIGWVFSIVCYVAIYLVSGSSLVAIIELIQGL